MKESENHQDVFKPSSVLTLRQIILKFHAITLSILVIIMIIMERFYGISNILAPSIQEKHVSLPQKQNSYQDRFYDFQVEMPIKPKFAWLLSFPNSGTSYTSRLIREATETTTASNYREGKKTPSLNLDYENGPFVLNTGNSLPKEGFTLTKTHCTLCVHEKKHLMKSTADFTKGCTTVKTGDGQCHNYQVSIMQKAVHLIRDPFDNIVSRFHLQYKDHLQKNDTAWLETHPYNKSGFRQWCDDYQHQPSGRRNEIRLHRFFKRSGIRCAIEFFLYIQFHNKAFDMTRAYEIPTHLVHYSDYSDDFDNTLQDLLTFLELKQVSKQTKFEMKSHDDYFDIREKKRIAAFLYEFASTETWDQIHDRYLSVLIDY